MKNNNKSIRLLPFTAKKSKKFNLITFSLTFLISGISYAQTPEQKSKIIEETNVTKLKELEQQYTQKTTQEKTFAIEAAEKNGWEISEELPNGGFKELQRVTEDGIPIYYTTFNDDAAISTRTNHLNSNGSLGLSLDGQNMTAHVWDGGYGRTSHQEFINEDGSSRILLQDYEPTVSAPNANYHGTHVIGTIAAAGIDSKAKGMAPKSQIHSYDWDNNIAEIAAAAAEGMLISNHSYGLSGDIPVLWVGGYVSESAAWDEIAYNAPYTLMVVAAGNSGNASNSNPLEGNYFYDKLLVQAVSKNTMAVANAQDAEIDEYGNLISAEINITSSEGPTDDYRIKPDITGNGTSLYSTYNESDISYSILTGTSMSSPNVTGSLLLLQQHYENLNGNFMKAATLKGLALHTADDAGSEGPDAVFGWGLLNAKAAAETISTTSNGSVIEELTLTSGESYSITVDSDGINPLLASISWTDPAGTVQTITNDNTPVLVNDLDITVTKEATTYYPYKLTSVTTNDTGDNTVDPFERVDINDASGTYTITITHKGNLVEGAQNYSLIVTGLSSTPAVCTATIPEGISTNNIHDVSAQISWPLQSATTFELNYREVGTTDWTTQTVEGYAYSLSELSPTTTYEVQVQSSCANGTVSEYSDLATFTTGQIEYCRSLARTNGTIIGNVNLGDINNTSNNYNGYADFTHISTNLNKGESNTIVITKDQIYPPDFYLYVHIDYNQNGSLEDDGELVWSATTSHDTDTVRGNFTVPETAMNGATRMRIISSNTNTVTPCLSLFYGETEDYTVIINDDVDGTENNCETGITTFPYQEGFENGLGDWAQDSTDDLDWSIHTGGTTTNNTGPAAASEGDYYLYVEASSNGIGYPAKGAILTSPCIDLSSTFSSSFSFDYHMYGATEMGTFDVEISTDSGNTWNSIWSKSGRQEDAWLTATIDLSAYVDSGIQLRFNRITGFNWRSDLAIDNIAIGGTLSGKELSNETFTIFPVPTSGNILNVSTTEITPQAYTIYNMHGQEVSKGTFSNTINIGQLTAGSYLIKIGIGNSQIKQFIKL